MFLGVSDKVQILEDLSQRLHEFSDAQQDLAASLQKYEDKVNAHSALESSAKDSKHLNKIKVDLGILLRNTLLYS